MVWEGVQLQIYIVSSLGHLQDCFQKGRAMRDLRPEWHQCASGRVSLKLHNKSSSNLGK